MEKERIQRYVTNLEQIIKNHHLYIKETIDHFREMCQMATPERNVPQEILLDIRKTYKEIQDQLTKIKEIQQLLQGKYRQYYRRDSLRDKEILEFGFLAKNCYLRFEYTLKEIEARKRLRERERPLQVYDRGEPFLWFRSKENQVMLLKNLQNLNDLGYEISSSFEVEERREVLHNRLRSLSLFVFSGDVRYIDDLQSRMRLREYDIKERYDRDELRGVLTHLRGISLSEAERVIRRFKERDELSKLKCLLFSIQSQKDLKKEVLDSAEKILHAMGEGEVKTLSI